MSKDIKSNNNSAISESTTDSKNISGIFKYKSLNLDDEILSTLSDDTLIFQYKNIENLLQIYQKSLLKYLNDKFILVHEIISRYAISNQNNNDYKFTPKFIEPLISNFNHENALIISIMENYLDRISALEQYKEIAIINDSKIEQQVQNAMNDGINIMNKLNNIELNHSLSFKNKYEFIIEQLKDQRDEKASENQILKQVLLRQTKLISELTFEIRHLKSSMNTKSTEDSIISTSSLSNGIESLRMVCNKYQHEYRKSVKSLETLLHRVKSDNTIQTDVLESSLNEMLQNCINALDSLNSLNVLELDHFQHQQISIAIDNIEILHTTLLHCLAQIYSSESCV